MLFAINVGMLFTINVTVYFGNQSVALKKYKNTGLSVLVSVSIDDFRAHESFSAVFALFHGYVRVQRIEDFPV